MHLQNQQINWHLIFAPTLSSHRPSTLTVRPFPSPFIQRYKLIAISNLSLQSQFTLKVALRVAAAPCAPIKSIQTITRKKSVSVRLCLPLVLLPLFNLINFATRLRVSLSSGDICILSNQLQPNTFKMGLLFSRLWSLFTHEGMLFCITLMEHSLIYRCRTQIDHLGAR